MHRPTIWPSRWQTGMEMGIALPHFLLDTKANGGILLLGIVGVGILLPLVIASCCISLKVGKIYRQLCHAPDVVHLLLFMKPSLAPSKVMGVVIKAAENTEIPVCRTDNESLRKLFMLVRSELNLDL
ncbi:hypothetical protein M0R45_037784 [Rubus argutus]|uniref:Uncharacterized protein n=1 Tax=Rubus argutus TaxID=59490 RepID=A0AAW1W1H1_RUBAR